MGWDAVVFGELALDGTEGFSRWLETPVDADLLSGAAACFGESPLAGATVGAVIDSLRTWDRRQRLAFARLTIDLSAERVRIRAFLPETEYRLWASSLAMTWAAGARVGGRGTISFAGFLTAMFEHQVIVDASEPYVRTLGEAEILWLEDRAELHEMRVAIADRTATMVSSDWLEDLVEEDTARSMAPVVLPGRIGVGNPTPRIEPADSPDETQRMQALPENFEMPSANAEPGNVEMPEHFELPELPFSEAMVEAAIAPLVPRSDVVASTANQRPELPYQPGDALEQRDAEHAEAMVLESAEGPAGMGQQVLSAGFVVPPPPESARTVANSVTVKKRPTRGSRKTAGRR